MHPKVCSDTETSAEDATDTIQKTSPATSRLRLNIRLPFCAMANTRHLFIKSRTRATRVPRLRGELNKMGLWSQSRHIGPKLLCAAGALDDAAGRSLRSALRRHARRHKELHMLIVDAQIHLWNAGNPTTPWHRQIPAYTKADALSEMDAGGVDAAVLTPHTPWDPKANELAIEAARQHPDRFVILGNFPVDKPESRALVDTWKQRPSLQLILDHLGRPSGGTASQPDLWANLPEVVALARYPNVAMKATGAPSYSGNGYTCPDIHDNLHRLYDAFGPTRFFWGTDITRMPCPWRQCVTLFTEELSWLKGRDLELVMGRAVCDWLGWKRCQGRLSAYINPGDSAHTSAH